MSSTLPKEVRYSVGYINHEHEWYIAKMEGIASVIVTAVYIGSPLYSNMHCLKCVYNAKVAYDNI